MQPKELPKDKWINFVVAAYVVASTVSVMNMLFWGSERFFLESEQGLAGIGMLGGAFAAFLYQRAKHMPASRNMMTNGSGQNYVFLMFLLILSAIISYPFVSPGRETIVFGSGYFGAMAGLTIVYYTTLLVGALLYWIKYFRGKDLSQLEGQAAEPQE